MKIGWKKMAVAALIVVLCMGTVALAGGFLAGYVNWNGDFVPEERPQIAAVPTAAPEMASEDFRRAIALISTAEDGEVVLVYETNGFGGTSSSSNRLTRHVGDYESFLTIMADAPMVPLPNGIPEGYALSECNILYECRAGGAYVLTSTEDLGGGVTVERYRVAEEDLFIRGYELIFRNPEDRTDYIAVWASLSGGSDPEDHRFGLNPDQTAQVVQVPGMDNALVITSGTRASLNMRRALPETIRYQVFDVDGWDLVGRYDEVQVDVRSRLASVETMIAMFAAE